MKLYVYQGTEPGNFVNNYREASPAEILAAAKIHADLIAAAREEQMGDTWKENARRWRDLYQSATKDYTAHTGEVVQVEAQFRRLVDQDREQYRVVPQEPEASLIGRMREL